MAGDARVIRSFVATTSELRDGHGYARHFVDASVGASNLDLHVNYLRPGPGPYHYHSNSENVYYALGGRLRVRIAGKEEDLDAGDAVFIPPGVPHSVTNIGTGNAVVLEVYSPPNPDFQLVPEPPRPNTARGRVSGKRSRSRQPGAS